MEDRNKYYRTLSRLRSCQASLDNQTDPSLEEDPPDDKDAWADVEPPDEGDLHDCEWEPEYRRAA